MQKFSCNYAIILQESLNWRYKFMNFAKYLQEFLVEFLNLFHEFMLCPPEIMIPLKLFDNCPENLL